MSENVNKICKVCGDNCDCGRYIGKYFDAKKYNTYMSIPDTIQKQIADYLFKQLEIEKCKSKKIEVFTAGVGPGRIEIPFLYKCIKDGKGINLKITAVDLDTGMLREFYDNIRKVFTIEEIVKPIETKDSFENKKGIHYFNLKIKSPNSNKVEIEAFCGNLENLNKKENYFKESHYDYVFSIFVLHAITNWEEPLYHLLRMLKPGGKIVFAEEIGDVNWLDNHFDDIEKYGIKTEKEVRISTEKEVENEYSEDDYNKDYKYIDLHRKFWKEYHRARKEGLGKEWAKDTKASDLGVIETCFQRMKDLGLFKDHSFNEGSEVAYAMKEEKKNIFWWQAEEPFTFNQLLKWVKGEEQLYTPLNYGLSSPNPQNKKGIVVNNLEIGIDNEKDNPWEDEYLHKNFFDNETISDQDAIGIYMEWWLKKEYEPNKKSNDRDFCTLLKKEIPRIEGHKFYVYAKSDEYNSEKDDRTIYTILYGNTVNLHRLKDRIAHEIHQIPGNYKGKVPPKETTHRLFALNDMYFRLFPFTHNIYTRWILKDPSDLTKGDLDKKNVPVLLTFPKLHCNYKGKDHKPTDLINLLKKYLATYILYTWLTFPDKGIKDFSFTDFVFRNMPEKFPIIIKKEGNRPYIHFSQVPSGKVKRLTISVPEGSINSFIKRCIFVFKTNSPFSFDSSITKILDEANKDINDFINKHKFYNNFSEEYQHCLMFQGNDFLDFARNLRDTLSFSAKNIERFKSLYEEIFKNEINEIKNRFEDIAIYNNWTTEGDDKLDVSRFLYSAIHTAIIGYSTEGEWDIFAKYPGKCFEHEIKDKTNTENETETEDKSYKTHAREESVGGLIVMRKKIDNKKEDLEKIFERNHEGILPIITGLWGRNDSILELNRLTKETMIKHGTKAAVAAIMGRNMSHLLGSHIDPGIVNDMDSFEKAVKGAKNKIECKTKKTILSIREKSIERYSTYRQRRMDFIARVSTQWPSWGAGYEFYKQFVFPFMSNSILLHFVGYSDGFSINNISFEFEIDSQRTSEIININGNENGLTPRDIAVALCVFDRNGEPLYEIKTKDYKPINLWSRGGDMGIAAFYIILENVIRNSIKHNKITKKKIELDICLFNDIDNLNHKVKFFSNCRLSNNKRFSYIVISSKADNGNTAKNIDSLISRSVINENGKIDPEAWGIKEIKICAAFLANKPDSSVNDAVPDFIQAGTLNDKLAYCFHIPKLYYIGELVEMRKVKL